MTTNEIFADGIVELSITGGLVRMDLYSLSALEKEADGKPKMEFRQRVVMPMEGFARSFGMMENVMRKLVQDGVIKVSQNPAAGDEAVSAVVKK